MTSAGTDPTADAFAERIVAAGLAALDLQTIRLGDRLGCYRAMASGAPVTSAQLAELTGTAERYAREWLEQQAVTGVLDVVDDTGDPATRTFRLPAGHAEVLTDVLSPAHVTRMATLTGAFARQADALERAYRTGGGVSRDEQGDDARHAQAAANRRMLLDDLPRTHLPSIPGLAETLHAGGRVADVGCGFGWSSIGIALAYPQASVDAFDVDVPSVEAARRNAAETGVSDRVRFHVADAAETGTATGGGYDLVLAVECVHDLPDPVGVLAGMRRLAGPGATVLVVDERVAETFTAPGDEVERLMYAYSVLCCLPDGMAHPQSAATGTVMRPDTLRRYASEAGFARVDVLDVEDDFFRFYRLVTG
ncbi:SAM-dependent methyltransferase [Pseudonocardia sulfidoxydans NBRC 16205]|uniref:SAM-dependent methyltransferase n=1 Tax=Pseudonocardia sulfidoxydans NBRC 16205 TaxID=1223511 RepID=A0A511DMX5_9PSEU|nr:SAM-dependent methyltransferase [Pseudonocardia sulfidoxydans NBRC 16205]